MKNLVIVEAAGKVDILKRELKGIGLFADVVATVGHIADNPKSLSPIALNEDLHELAYEFREDRSHLLEKLRRAAAGADRIFVATDDDQEGDVIAYDVSRLLADRADILYRVRLRSITAHELQSAFDGQLSQQFEPFARNGICRRVVDRAIGAVFTRVAESSIVSVGRVQSSLLAAIKESPPVAGHYTMRFEESDGSVFGAHVPVRSATELRALEALASSLASGHAQVLRHSEKVEPRAQPWSYEDVVCEVSDRLKMSVDEAADLFQKAYERGRISYPRVRGASFTRDAVEVAAEMAANNRCSFDPALLKVRSSEDGRGAAHESPRALDGEMPLGRPLNVLQASEAVAVLIGRNVIECGQSAKVRTLTVKHGESELELRCVMNSGRRNWKDPDSTPGYHPYARDYALLKYMGALGLGRPSTVVEHATRVIRRALIAETGVAVSLNDRGERWLERASAFGFIAHTSTEMESAMAKPMRDPYQRAREILASHGMLDVVKKHVAIAGPLEAPNEAFAEPG